MIRAIYSIVLRVAVSSTEFQDAAVIEVSKIIQVRAIVQIIEALYGRDYIVEPSYNRNMKPWLYRNKTVVDKSIIIQTPLCVDNWPCCISLFSSIFSLYFALALGLLFIICSMDAASLL
jgi:hypothetical protein